jgi:hypothetical protein
MAVDALVDTAKLVRLAQRQDPPPAVFSLRRPSGRTMHDRLADLDDTASIPVMTVAESTGQKGSFCQDSAAYGMLD